MPSTAREGPHKQRTAHHTRGIADSEELLESRARRTARPNIPSIAPPRGKAAAPPPRLALLTNSMSCGVTLATVSRLPQDYAGPASFDPTESWTAPVPPRLLGTVKSLRWQMDELLVCPARDSGQGHYGTFSLARWREGVRSHLEQVMRTYAYFSTIQANQRRRIHDVENVTSALPYRGYHVRGTELLLSCGP